MLESVLALVLNRTIGWLVEDVNASDLKLAISRGDVVLQNLSVRKDAFGAIDNPFEIRSGTIKQLRLVIPWSNVSKQPTIVQIDGLEILCQIKQAGPSSQNSKVRHGKEEGGEESWDRFKERKQAALDRSEVERKAKAERLEKSKEDNLTRSSWMSRYVSDVTESIAKNLRVKITNLHLQITHPSTTHNHNFAVGLVLDRFSLVPCPAASETASSQREGQLHGSPSSSPRDSNKKKAFGKEGRVSGLKVYYTSSTLDPSDSVVELLAKKSSLFHLLVEDTEMTLDLPETFLDFQPGKPMARVVAHVESVNVNVDYQHFHNLQKLAADYSAQVLFLENREARPSLRPSRDPRGWWRYVLLRVKERNRERRARISWPYLRSLFDKRKEYVALYKRRFTAGGPSVSQLTENQYIDEADAERLAELEMELPLSATMMFRTIAEFELVQAYTLRNNSGFTQRWLGVGAAEKDSLEREARRRAKILALELLDFRDIPDDLKWLFDLSFTLNDASLSLFDSTNPSRLTSTTSTKVAQVDMDVLQLHATSKGAKTVVNVQILDVRASNGITGAEVLYFNTYTDRKPCMTVDLESSLEKDDIPTTTVSVEPVHLWIDADFIGVVMAFLRHPNSDELSKNGRDHQTTFEDEFLSALVNLQSYNVGHRADALANFQRSILSVHVAKPLIVLPTPAKTSVNSILDARDALVIELDSLDVESNFEDVSESFLAGYTLFFTGFQLYLDRALPSSSALLDRNPQVRRALIEPFSFKVLQKYSICPQDVSVPAVTKQVFFQNRMSIKASPSDILRAQAVKASIDKALYEDDTGADIDGAIAPGLGMDESDEDRVGLGNQLRGLDLQLLAKTLEPEQVKLLSNVVLARTDLTFSTVSISLLSNEDNALVCKLYLGGGETSNMYTSETRLAGSRLLVHLSRVRVVDAKSRFEAMTLSNLLLLSNELSSLRPVWFNHCPLLLDVDGRLPPAVFRTPSIVSNVQHTVFTMSELCFCTQEMFLEEVYDTLLCLSPPNSNATNSQNTTHAASSASSMDMVVSMWIPSVCWKMVAMDWISELGVIKVVETHLCLKDFQQRNQQQQQLEVKDEPFVFWLSVHGLRVYEGSESEEGVLWHHSHWGQNAQPHDPHVFDLLVKRKHHSWSDLLEPFNAHLNLRELRLSISSPLLSLLVAHTFAILPPMEENQEPLKLPSFHLNANIVQLVAMIPRCPRVADPNWRTRSVLAFRFDSLSLRAVHRILDAPPTPVAPELEPNKEVRSLAHSAQSSSNEFFDALSEVDDELDDLLDAEEDVALSLDMELTNVSGETWLFEEDLFQTLFRTSVAASVDWNPEKNKVWLQVTPIRFSCSQVQYALVMDLMELNRFDTIMPPPAPGTVVNKSFHESPLTTSSSAKVVSRKASRTSLTSKEPGAVEVLIKLSLDAVEATLFREDGGDRIPGWGSEGATEGSKLQRFSSSSTSQSTTGSLSGTRVVNKSSSKFKILHFGLVGAEVFLESDSFPDSGRGSFSIESVDVVTFMNREKLRILRTDRMPVLSAELVIHGKDDLAVEGSVAQIELDSFELFASWGHFSQVEAYSLSKHAIETSSESDDRDSLSIGTSTTGTHSLSTVTDQELSAQPVSTAAAVASARLSIPKTIRVKIQCGEVKVILSPTRNPIGLVVMWGFHLELHSKKDDQVKFTAVLANMRMAKCKITNRVLDLTSSAFVLKPFTTSASLYVSVPGPVSNPADLSVPNSDDLVVGSVNVSSIFLDIGREDYLLLQASSLMTASNGKRSNNASHQDTPSSIQPSMSLAQQANAFHDLLCPPVSHRKVTLAFEIAKSSVILLQDWNDYCPPIARFQLQHFKADMEQYDYSEEHTQTRIDVQLCVQANYWNQDIGAWESLVEPWFLKVSVDLPEFLRDSARERVVHTLGYLKSDPVRPVNQAAQFIRVESPHMLNINVTPAALEQINALSTFTAVDPDSSSPQAARILSRPDLMARNIDTLQADVIVRNEVGVEFQVALHTVSAPSVKQFLAQSGSRSEAHEKTMSVFAGAWAWKSDPTGLIWKKRFITVQGGALKYFKTMKHVQLDQPAGMIHLVQPNSAAYLKMDAVVGKKAAGSRFARECAFQLVTRGRTYYFVATTVEGKTKLLEAISSILESVSSSMASMATRKMLMSRTSVIRFLLPDKGRERFVAELDMFTLNVFPHKGYRLDPSRGQGEEATDRDLTPLVSIDVSKYCLLKLSRKNPSRFLFLGPTFHFEIVELDHLAGPPVTDDDDAVSGKQSYASNSRQAKSDSVSSVPIGETRTSGLFLLLSERIDFRNGISSNDEKENLSSSSSTSSPPRIPAAEQIRNAGALHTVVNFLVDDIIEVFRSHEVKGLRVWMLPKGSSKDVDLSKQAETASPNRVSFDIPCDRPDCTREQLIKFDVISNDNLVLASATALYSELVSANPVEREFDISFFRTSGPLAIVDSQELLFKANVCILPSDNLCPPPTAAKHPRASSEDSVSSNDEVAFFQRVLPNAEVGLYLKQNVQDGVGVLSLQMENNKPTRIPTKSSGRFALPLSAAEEDADVGSKPFLVNSSYQNTSITLPKFLVCNVHFEEGSKLCTISSNTVVKNRLQKPLQVTFCRLFRNLSTPAHASSSSSQRNKKFWLNQDSAFDGWTETYWTGNFEDSDCKVEYKYVDRLARRVMVYSIASAPQGHAPSEWVVEGLTQRNNTWVVLDEQKNIFFTKQKQIRSFSMSKTEPCVAYRFVFLASARVGSKMKHSELSMDSVSVGNIMLYSQEQVEKHDRVERGAMLSVRLEPGQTTSIPLEVLTNGGAVKFGSGNFVLLEELLYINSWKIKSTYKRWKPRYMPATLDSKNREFCTLHVSFHRLEDVAKLLRDEKTNGSSNAPFWVLTIDAPLVIENLLPFPLHYRVMGKVRETLAGEEKKPVRRMASNSSQNSLTSPLLSSGSDVAGQPILVKMNTGGPKEIVVEKGKQSQCLCIDPTRASKKRPWSQRVADVFTVDSVRLPFAVRNVDRFLRCQEDGTPVIFGEGVETNTGPILVPLEGTELQLRVEIMTKKRDDLDVDHQHFHETSVLRHQTGEGPDQGKPTAGAFGDEESDEDEDMEPDYFDAFEIGSSGILQENAAMLAVQAGKDDGSALLPQFYHTKCFTPVRIVLYCPVLVLNWSGLALSYSGEEQESPAKQSKGGKRGVTKVMSHGVSQSEGEGILSAKEAKSSMESIVRIEMFSSATDKMSISLKDGSGWSKRFGLAIGMSGEVTIPPVSESDVIHQVGVSISTAPGRFLRTKVVTITPRFMIVNRTSWNIRLAQDGAEKGTWQFSLNSNSLGPFHPTDVNRDGALDDKDFAVQLGLFSEHGKFCALSKSFRLDVVQRKILKLRNPEVDGSHLPDVLSATDLNCLSPLAVPVKEELHLEAVDHFDVLTVSTELVDNVVRVMISECSDERAFDYRVDNLCSFLRVGLVQQGMRYRTMCMVDPGAKEVEWVWEDSTGAHKVDVVFETVGLSAMDRYPRGQPAAATIDFDRVGDVIRINCFGVPVELTVQVQGLTKVLIIDDLKQARSMNKARRVLQERLLKAEERLLSARKLLAAGLSPIRMKISPQGSSADVACLFDGNANTTWKCSKRPSEEFVVCNLLPYTQVIDAYGFSMRRGRSGAHPRVWRLYGQAEENGTWMLLDVRNFHFNKSDLSFFVVSNDGETVEETIFRLPRRSPPCISFKLVMEGPFSISSLRFFYDKNYFGAEEEDSRKAKHLWLSLLEARDLPIMDLYTSDPYAVIRVGESGSKKKSKVVNKTLQPVFDQEFSFENVGPDDFIYVDMYDKDLFSKDDYIGSAKIRVKSVCSRGEPADVWLTLRNKHDAVKGQVRIVFHLVDRPLSFDSKYLNALRFPRLFQREVEIFRQLENKLQQEGGVTKKRHMITNRRTSAWENGEPVHVQGEQDVEMGASISEETLLEERLKLCVTVLEANGIIQPSSIGGGKLKEVYCIITYGDRSLRTDPVPFGNPIQTHDIGRAQEEALEESGEFAVVFNCEGPLGIQFERLPSGEFAVKSVAADSPARRDPRILPGVKLIGIQNSEITSAWSLSTLRDLLSTSPRPLRLKFEDDQGLVVMRKEMSREFVSSTDFPRCNVAWMQQLNFDEADTLRAMAKEETGQVGTELEHRRAKISIFARDPKEEPSLDVRNEASENQLLIPLLYLFGEDVEMDAELRGSQEKFGDCDILLGETTLLLPEMRSAKVSSSQGDPETNVLSQRTVSCPLDFHGLIGAGSIKLQVGWTLVDKNPADCIFRGVEMRLRGFGVSLVDTAVRKCELAYISLQDVRLYIGDHLDGRQVYDAYIGRLQIDNQMFSAVHPIVLCAAPLPFPWLLHEDQLYGPDFVQKDAEEYASNTHRAPPAMLVTLVKRNSGNSSNLTYVEFFDFYMQEINLKLEERWLTAIQDFASSLESRDTSSSSGATSSSSSSGAASAVLESSASFSSSASRERVFRDGDTLDGSEDANDLGEEEHVQDRHKSESERKEQFISSASARTRAFEHLRMKEVIWKTFAAHNPVAWVKEVDFGDDDDQQVLQQGGKKSNQEEPRILVERADIKPIKINLTFSMTSDQEKKMDNRLKILHLLQGVPVLAAFASALVNTVANISDAPLRFNSLQIFNQGMSVRMLQTTLRQHMADQLFSNLAQMGNLLASADLLGSPVKLIGSFGKGAYSFFYEPALALSMNGYLGIGKGLFKGGGELVRGTTHGLAYSLQKFAETASRALAQASLDSRYILKEAHRRTDVVHEPINIAEGFDTGLRAFGSGIFDGVLGIAVEPYRGVRRYGPRGFFAGVGKGLLGVIIKPLCAMFDAAALFLRGLTNTTETLAKQQLPVRLRRFVGPNLSVEAYSAREAIGNYFLALSRLTEVMQYLYHGYVVQLETEIQGAMGWEEFDQIVEQQESTAEVELDSHHGHGRVALVEGVDGMVFVTTKFLLFARMKDGRTMWSVPLSFVRKQTLRGSFLKIEFSSEHFSIPGRGEGFQMGIILRCRSDTEALQLQTIVSSAASGEHEECRSLALRFDQRSRLDTGLLSLSDPVGALETSLRARKVMTSVLRKMNDEYLDSILSRMENVRQEEALSGFASSSVSLTTTGCSTTTKGVARRLLGMRVLRAVLTGRKTVYDNGAMYVVYRIVVGSAETEESWVVWRRFSEFRKLRDNLMKTMKKSRTALPLPSRHPWRLSTKGLNQRQLGLNRMLQTMMDVDTIRESPLCRVFLTTGAENVLLHGWERLLHNDE